MAARPLVSVIMPCGDVRWLDTAVRSVLGQTMGDLELIVVMDGAKSDIDIPNRRLRVIHISERSGPAAARSRGIDLATGRWIAFCDADDWWFPRKLEVQLAAEREADTLVLCSSYQRLKESAESAERTYVIPPPRITYADLTRGPNVIGNLTAMYDTEKAGKVLPPDLGLSSAVDLPLWLKILKGGGHALGIPDVLACYRVHPGGISSNKIKIALNRARILRGEGLSWTEVGMSTVRYARASFASRIDRQLGQ